MLLSTQTFSTLLLGVTALTGDYLIKLSTADIYRALFDNSTHSIIGGLTWFVVANNVRKRTISTHLFEVAVCAALASVIDLDHFFAARSTRLRDATNLQERPPLHCSTIPITITLTLLLYANVTHSETIYRLAWIIFAAFASHHIRDGTRRGLWLYPFGSTSPIPYYVYITLIMALPFYIKFMMNLGYINIISSDDIFLEFIELYRRFMMDDLDSLKLQFYATLAITWISLLLLGSFLTNLYTKIYPIYKQFNEQHTKNEVTAITRSYSTGNVSPVVVEDMITKPTVRPEKYKNSLPQNFKEVNGLGAETKSANPLSQVKNVYPSFIEEIKAATSKTNTSAAPEENQHFESNIQNSAFNIQYSGEDLFNRYQLHD